MEVVQVTLLGQQESLLAQKSHLLSCTNTRRVFCAERGRQEVPPYGSNLQSQQDRSSPTAAGVKQEVPPQKSCAEQATSPGHTCVAVRAILGSPRGKLTVLGPEAWKGGKGDNFRGCPGCDITHPFLELARTIPKLAEFPPFARRKKCLATLGSDKTCNNPNFMGKKTFYPTSERKWKFCQFLWKRMKAFSFIWQGGGIRISHFF